MFCLSRSIGCSPHTLLPILLLECSRAGSLCIRLASADTGESYEVRAARHFLFDRAARSSAWKLPPIIFVAHDCLRVLLGAPGWVPIFSQPGAFLFSAVMPRRESKSRRLRRSCLLPCHPVDSPLESPLGSHGSKPGNKEDHELLRGHERENGGTILD